MRTTLIFFCILLLGCSSQNPITGSLTAPLAPLTPIQAGVSAGVMLEDLTEDQATDDQHASFLELLSDGLSAPWYLTAYTAAGVGAFLWTLTDYPDPPAFKRHAQTILEYLPIYHAAPQSLYPKDPKPR